MIAGAGSFVVAAGLQVSGYQNPFVGAGLVLLGIVCWVFAAAMVVARYRRGQCLVFVTGSTAMNREDWHEPNDNDPYDSGHIEGYMHRVVLTNTCDEPLDYLHVSVSSMTPLPASLQGLVPGAELTLVSEQVTPTVVKDQLREFDLFGYPQDYENSIYIRLNGRWRAIEPRTYIVEISAIATDIEQPIRRRFMLTQEEGRPQEFTLLALQKVTP